MSVTDDLIEQINDATYGINKELEELERILDPVLNPPRDNTIIAIEIMGNYDNELDRSLAAILAAVQSAWSKVSVLNDRGLAVTVL